MKTNQKHKGENKMKLDHAEIKPQMTFTVIDSWTNPNRQWTWTKLADLDTGGRKMMDATLTAAFAQMIINNPNIKDHTITV